MSGNTEKRNGKESQEPSPPSTTQEILISQLDKCGSEIARLTLELGKLREGIPQPQRLSRRQVETLAQKFLISREMADNAESVLALADFALSLDVTTPSNAKIQRVREAFQELGKAWEIDPMGDRYREADNELDDAIAELAEDVTLSGDGQKEKK